jgi:dUTPase
MDKSNLRFFVCGPTDPPRRDDGYDAGFDIMCPHFTEQFCKDLTEKNPGQPVRWSIVGGGQIDEKDPDRGFYIQINPHQDILIPTYLKTRFDKGWVLECMNKSGVATLQKLDKGAEVIDSSYEGICHVHLTNTSDIPQFVSFGQKLAQFVIKKIDPEPAEVWYDESLEYFKELKNTTTLEKFYEGHESKRKDGGFGSTGKFAGAKPKGEGVPAEGESPQPLPEDPPETPTANE